MEKITVIIPVYNVASFLERALKSITCQTYTNLQILLIDDGSTDESGKICDDWVKKDSRIQCVHQENAGVSVARNHGLDLAVGEYIMFIDADDWVEPEMIESLHELILKHQAGVSACRYVESHQTEFLSRDEKKDGQITIVEGQVEAGIQLLLPWSVYCKLYRADLLHNIRLKKYKIAEDLLFNTDIICEGKLDKVVFIDIPYYHYFIRDDSAIRQEYQKKYIDGVKVEENCYDRLIQISPRFGDINIVGCSVSMLFERIAELSHAERKKIQEDFRWMQKNAKEYKKALLNVSDRHRKISGVLKVYVPDLYLWTLIIRKRKNK